MFWVDELSYVGPDRRESRHGASFGLRMRERRKKDRTRLPPSLDVALRHLRARVHDAAEPQGLDAFCRRAQAVAMLANAYRRRDVGDVLMRLVRALRAGLPDDAPPASTIYEELDRAEDLIAADGAERGAELPR